ncbi:antA/AntB antirepressor family protein [Salmonella enterica]|uniref:antA/AntB antirepressor family protein n=1 Tax=Salmonella enterica TaxID=28901 RepID=UPI000D56B1CA|nr:antA/AntB antirepressor family protein [Salmonella enterica]EAQ0347308.1 phage antirepressor Ant [Salmonella enterica]EAQ7631880.1 phage antirepressor Ant [Salmonella enterica]EBG4323043.1 phage antirepressor Ant [Salmonella enterica]ECK3193489.1 phage antirepressor Ant [Salmonella enterica]EDZ7633254.1 phage antirepressor Ant [Salmonella enterica]
MTDQLVPLFNGVINNEPTLLCNARDLHAFLGAGKHFASWITERIEQYGFVENQDYIIASQNREAKIRGGHNRKDYHLTLDTAKEVAMVERNEKGRQIRRYFIECEKQLRQQQTLPAPKPLVHTITLTDEELCDICWLWKISDNMQQAAKKIYPGLLELGSQHTGVCRDAAYESVQTIKRVRNTLLRVTTKTEFAPELSPNWRRILPQLRQPS